MNSAYSNRVPEPLLLELDQLYIEWSSKDEKTDAAVKVDLHEKIFIQLIDISLRLYRIPKLDWSLSYNEKTYMKYCTIINAIADICSNRSIEENYAPRPDAPFSHYVLKTLKYRVRDEEYSEIQGIQCVSSNKCKVLRAAYKAVQAATPDRVLYVCKEDKDAIYNRLSDEARKGINRSDIENFLIDAILGTVSLDALESDEEIAQLPGATANDPSEAILEEDYRPIQDVLKNLQQWISEQPNYQARQIYNDFYIETLFAVREKAADIEEIAVYTGLLRELGIADDYLLMTDREKAAQYGFSPPYICKLKAKFRAVFREISDANSEEMER